ncbi:hypothetical protein V7S43_000771 [Phytophthora oleae]|uniref:VLIG-type G domain-containing protein n=1 Tax=Phytophthora oleae TaxID=2107226 RepID=A0ABD3GAC8_9STRA
MSGEPAHLEKLKAAMDVEPKDPVELARLLREAHDDLQSDNKSLFSSDEKELLVAAGLAVLDPALTELLRQLRMTDIAPLLVYNRACDLNTAARALTAGALNGSLESAVLAALTAKLETRGAIFEAGAITDSGAWIDQLCHKYPTKRALLQSKWATLESLMQSDEHVSEADKEAVWTVWSEGHDFRKKVKEFGLPPSVADRVVDSGFQSMEFMKESELIEIQHGLSDAVKAKLRRMWARESAEGRTERDSMAQKREALIAKTKDAAALVTALKSDVGAEGAAIDSGTSQALDAALTSLGLSQWSSNVERVQDPALLSDSLTQLGNVLERTEAALASETGDHESDEVVISRASGRLALHAVSFGYSASELGKKASRPLLRTPEYCPLLGPEMSTTMKSTVHNSIEAADNYRQSIRSCGETIAAALKVSGWGFHAEAGHSKGKQELSIDKVETARRSTTAVSVTYGVVPVKSFQISQEQMKLSNEAESAALAVTTLAEARIFLEDFGSHVPSGTQHLGGIFWKIVEIRAEDETESQELEKALAKETDTSFGLGGGAWNVEAAASGGKRSFDSLGIATGFVDQKRLYTATTRIECTGPNVSNYDLFSQVLAANNLSWFVIDRGTPKALVPVWDLLSPSVVSSDSKSKAIERTGKLLRTAWLENAQQLAFLPAVQHLLYRAQIREWIPLKSLELEISSEEQSQYQLSKKVDEVSSIPLDDINPQVLRKAVEDAFSAMFRFDYQFGTFVVADYVRDGAFPEFLSGLASKSAAPNVLPALRFLSAVLDTPMKAKLLAADPPVALDKKLEAVLDDIRSSAIESPEAETELQIWRAPVVPLSDLPSTVKSMADALMQSAPNDLESLTKRVGSVLSLNLWRTSDTSNLRSQLQDVASKFWCSRDGFSLPLTVASLKALITEMEQVIQPPLEKKAVLPDDTPRFVFDTDTTVSDGLPYSYVRIDRPTPDRAQDLRSCILHALMHRLDIHSSLYPTSQQTTSEETALNEPEKEVGPARRSRRAARFSHVTQSKQPKAEGVFDAAIHLLLSLDTSARSEVLRLLLERRFLVPFIIPTSTAKDNAPFHCDITSLGLITTAVGHDGEDTVRANLATDTSYMRVAVLSDRTKEEGTSKDWIESVFNVQSLHTLDCKNNVEITKTETAAEIGWGFLERGDRDYVPVILLHVVGDYRPLAHFIELFADAVVLDAGSSDGSCDINLQHGTLVTWRLADPDQESTIESNEDDPVLVESLRCRYTTSVTMITKSLLDEFADWLDEFKESEGRNKRVPLASLEPIEVLVHQAPRFDFGAVEPKTAFANLRSELQLQLVFAQESHEVIALQRESDPVKQASQQTTIATFQRLRQDLAPDIDCHTIVKLFKDILRNESASSRMITLLDLERWLAVQCEEQGVSARKAYREARDNYNKNRSTANCEVLVQALQDWDMKITGMEHLWRELSHLYVVDPVNRGCLATFAAQHLLDGFSLELMDGDAGMMNLTWIQGVLTELHRKLGTARLLVLSVMGVQSSGKSTLLNYMFGVRLRTSVSRCTRGVSIQLLKCKDRNQYEYILLLDTEGIRAPEYIGTDDSVWRDNRMATFAILPADATIILTKGESTITINEILPIVLSAYLESETAQKNAGHLPSKLLFVFNQIDLAEKSKLENVVDTLMRELNENARKVEEIRLGIHLEEGGQKTPHRSTSGVFHDLNVDVANEEGSDVRVLGTIKAESHPPRDAPLPDYGRRLLKLREHIHRRVCTEKSWKGRNVEEFCEYITMVWKCIERSNFHLNFVAAYERINYDILVHKVDQCAQQLTSLYCTAFDAISKEIRKDADNSRRLVNVSELLVKYDERLSEAMINHLKKLDGDVKLVLEDERFGKWSTDQLSTWTRYKTDQAAHWRRMMDGQVNNIFLYEALVEGYKKKLRDRANRIFGDGGLLNVSPLKQQRKFDGLFKKLVNEANEKHPPFYKEVTRYVDQVFARNKDLWWMIKGGNPDPAAKAPSLLARFNLLSSEHHQKRKLQSLQSSIERDVKATLAGVTQYSDGIVVKCIQLTKVALVNAESEMSVSDDTKKVIFRKVADLIRKDLKAIQRTWDSKNSVAARFETCRTQMNSYFNNLGRGWKGMDLLKASVCDWLRSNLQKSFEEELTAIVGTNLKGKRWVANADVMQAMVDKSLVHDLDMHDIKTALNKIAYPKRHIEDVVSQLIYLEVRQCSTERLTAYKEALKDSIRTAARSALGVEKDLALTFLSILKSKIREYLHTAATNRLLTTIPTPSDPNFNCDEQSAEIFNPTNKYFVCSEMLEVVDRFTDWSVDVTQSVLAYIKDRAHGASRGVMPRCGELCPKCKSPCTRELGHVTSEEEKRHDSYHQPVGLVGMHLVNTHELVAGSCSFNANIRTFVHTDGKEYKYSDFDKVFPNWSLPVEKEPLMLREHIFYNYQKELTSLYLKQPCPQIPPTYNHLMGDIKQHIDKLLSP